MNEQGIQRYLAGVVYPVREMLTLDFTRHIVHDCGAGLCVATRTFFFDKDSCQLLESWPLCSYANCAEAN